MFAVLVSLDGVLSLLGRASPPPVPAEFRTYTLEERSPTDRRYGPNRLTRSHGVWVMHTEGTAYEIGRASGLLAGELRGRLFQVESMAEAEAIFEAYLHPAASVAGAA